MASQKIPISHILETYELLRQCPKYISPGYTDNRILTIGGDCSGADVFAYWRFKSEYESKIYHGSNSIYRKNCDVKGRITSVDMLEVGMSVFKCREWAEDQASNQWYGTEPGDLCHIGRVTSVNPLRIGHISSGGWNEDTKLGKWTHWGWEHLVDYAGGVTPAPDVPDDVTPDKNTAIVVSESLRLRDAPTTSGGAIYQMKQGDVMFDISKGYTDSNGNPWIHGTVKGEKYNHKGYAMQEDKTSGKTYLSIGETETNPPDLPENPGDVQPPECVIPAGYVLVSSKDLDEMIHSLVELKGGDNGSNG